MQPLLGKTKSTVKVGGPITVLFSAPITVLFSAKTTRSNFRGACEKVLLEGHPNRILGFSELCKVNGFKFIQWYVTCLNDGLQTAVQVL